MCYTILYDKIFIYINHCEDVYEVKVNNVASQMLLLTPIQILPTISVHNRPTRCIID